MTESPPLRSSPWQNRPSLIATWNAHLAGIGSGSTSLLYLTQDGLSTLDAPVPVPRASRVARWAAYLQTTAYQGTVVLSFEWSKDCGANFSAVTGAFAVNDLSEVVRTCACGEFSTVRQPLDKCDLWRLVASFTPATNSPIIRVALNFELR